jgi:hypothetical protein
MPISEPAALSFLPTGARRHRLPTGFRFKSTPVLGGLHHEYKLGGRLLSDGLKSTRALREKHGICSREALTTRNAEFSSPRFRVDFRAHFNRPLCARYELYAYLICEGKCRTSLSFSRQI